MTQREEFEAWHRATQVSPLKQDADGEYGNAFTNARWEAWQAAQLKQAVRDAYEDVLGIDWFELMRNNFDKERSEHIAESIETAIRALIKEIPE